MLRASLSLSRASSPLRRCCPSSLSPGAGVTPRPSSLRPRRGISTPTARAMASDEEKAAAAAAPLADDAPTIFDKIVSRQIPADVIYEDDQCLAFRDIAPQAPVHAVLIPKHRSGLTRLSRSDASHKPLLGHLLWAAAEVARQQGLEPGYRVVINDGPLGSQSVYHLHLHILGGRQMTWPPG